MTRGRLYRGAREVVLLASIYGVYSLVRNLMGNDAELAERNARRLVDLQKALWMFHERSIQQALDHRSVMEPLNSFYGIAHFAVTGGLMVWLFLRRGAYARLRNAIVVTTGLALAGYAAFPLKPPRLVPDLGIADSLARYGSPWTYENGVVRSLTNQYAAMPSLHIAWALWCSWVIWREIGGVTLRATAVTYSLAATLAVVATGNHYILDAVGGGVVLLIGIAITSRFRIPWLRSSGTDGDGDVGDLEPGERSEAVVATVDGDHIARVVAARSCSEVHG